MDEKMNREGGSAAAPKKLQKSYFDVLGLCCSSEIPLIENILKQLDGVKDVSVIVASRTVIVVHDSLLVSQTQIVNALNQARLEANIKMRGGGDHKKKWPSPYAIASGTLLLLSFLKYAYRPLGWLALGAVAVGIFPIALRAVTAVRNIRLDINVLAVIAVAGTIAMRDYLEAATIVFLFSIADWLQSMASHKARAAMSSLMSIAPQKATIAETGEEVDVDEVKLNTVLAVKAGEVIPIDGIVVDGRSDVDEKTLTGESFPVSKEKDSSVWAGTINLNGYISVKTTALAEDCVVAKMAKLVEEAQNKRSRTQRFIDKFAQYYTPAIVVIFLCFLVIPIAVRVRNRDHWVELALVVLVSGCPCALVLSTPVATFCALTKAARSGLLIKGGDYLETLAKIKTIAFDKTGTITRGEFAVAEFKSISTEISWETLLYWVSSIESKSSHPLAAAVVHYGRSSGIVPKPEDVEEFQNYPGEGIYGRIDGRDFFIGNKKIASRAGCQTVLSLESDDAMGGKTVGYIFLGSGLVGVFSLSDECRTGVVEAIRELKSRKIRSVMLTGDSQGAAMNAQNQLGNALDQVYAELLPEDKSKIIQQLKENGPTAMVGDGINDAPALAISDIGISMGISGSALATETGHVILMSNDIRKIPKAINLARKAKRKVFENVFLSFFMRAVILALAFAGHPLVWAAVLTDTGTCLLVIMNSMLLLRGGHGHRHGQKCSRKSYDASEAQKCIGNDISQNRRQCCSEKNCDSSVLPQVQAECCESTNCASKQGCTEQKVSCESKNCGSVKKCTEECHSSKFDAGSDEIVKIPNPGEKARNNCCESTNCTSNQRCADQKVSCESRNCSSVKKCPRECHSSQFDASLDEIVEIPNPGEKQVCCSSSSALPSSGHCKSGATKTGCEVPNVGRKQGCCPKDSTETSRTRCEARTARNTNESDSELVPRCCSGSKCSKSQKANLDCKSEIVKGNAISCCTADDLEKNLHGPGSTGESSHKGHHDRVKCDDKQRSDSDLVPRCCSGSKCSKSQKANLDCKGEMVKGNAISCCIADDLEKNLHGPGSTGESNHKGHHDRVKCDDEQRSDLELVPRCCSGSKCSKSQKANLDCKGEMAKGNAISCCTADDLEKNLHGPGSTGESSHKGHHDRVKCDEEQRSGCRSQCCASSGLRDCERSGGRDGDLVIGSLQGSTETAAAAHGCCSLENREIGGCCRSYMEECCAKSRSGHLGHHGFGGCLTEIVIE